MEYDSRYYGWARGEIWAAGEHLATYTDATTYFSHPDGLGTERARTKLDGSVYQTCVSLPFGDAQNCSFPNGAASDDPLHFTGKPRDPEAGLDDFGARLYSSSLGRWMTPDWSAQAEPVPYAKLDNPQSLNLYAYVLNNPVSSVDPDGHCLEDACVGEAIWAAVALTSAYIASPSGQQAVRAAGQLVTSAVTALSNVFQSRNSDQPGSAPPAPVPTRGQALNDAKRDAGVPTSQQPVKQRNVPLTTPDGNGVTINGQKQMTREYTHTTGSGSTVIIQDHGQGHVFPDGGRIGPHFNVRPSNDSRNGQVPGTKPHYPYGSTGGI